MAIIAGLAAIFKFPLIGFQFKDNAELRRADKQPAAQPSTIQEMWDAWCARCHAADGSGKVAEPTITVEPMDFTDCSLATPEPDTDWELAIHGGGPAVGLSAEMPAFGDTLSSQQIRGFVDHIRSFCAETGWPIGNLNLPRPMFTEKAFPENELVLLPRLTRRRAGVGGENTGVGSRGSEMSLTDVEFTAIYERRFGKRGMWEVVLPMASHDTTGAVRRQGVGDVELAVKYVLAVPEPAIVSSGFELSLPTGSDVRGLGAGTTVFEPYVAVGIVVGRFYVQSQGKFEVPADTAKAERALVYNLYVGGSTSSAPNTWTLGVELNGENHEVALTPQLRKGLTKTGALAAAFGVQVPLNDRRARGTSVVGYLLWEYREPVRARR